MDHTAPDPPSAAAASGIAIREDGTVLADGRPLALSPTELALLRALVAAGGRALSRRDILFAMHGGPGNVREESLNFTVGTPQEAQALLDSLFACENSELTPAGRRIISLITTEELDKKF